MYKIEHGGIMASSDRESEGILEKFQNMLNRNMAGITRAPVSTLTPIFLQPYGPSNEFIDQVARKLSGTGNVESGSGSEQPIKFARLANPLNVVDGLLRSAMAGIGSLVDRATGSTLGTPKSNTAGIVLKAVLLTPFFVVQQAVKAVATPVNNGLDGIETRVREVVAKVSTSNQKNDTAEHKQVNDGDAKEEAKVDEPIAKVNQSESKMNIKAVGARAKQTWGNVNQIAKAKIELVSKTAQAGVNYKETAKKFVTQFGEHEVKKQQASRYKSIKQDARPAEKVEPPRPGTGK